MSLNHPNFKKSCGTRRGVNRPCQCEKCLLDTLVYLCRSLHEFDAELVRELAALFLCNRPLVRPVRLVADEDLVDAFRGMLLDIRVPCADICLQSLGPKIGNVVDRNVLTIERTLVGDVVHQQDPHSSTIVCSCDCPKPLLSSSVPLRKKLIRKQRFSSAKG